MFNLYRGWIEALSRRVAPTASFLLFAMLASAQTADFQIVWINVGEVATPGEGESARAGRQLFMAPDLVDLSLKKVTVAKVDVEPAVIPLKVGQRFCLTSLNVQASSENRSGVEDAPLTVAVRQDQRERLAIQRGKKDICFKPTAGGEFPVRFNSVLPARDGTTRGAQIFLRVESENGNENPSDVTASASG